MKKLLSVAVLPAIVLACGGSSNEASSANDIKSMPAYPDKKETPADSNKASATSDKPTDPKTICAEAKPVDGSGKKALFLYEKEPSFGADLSAFSSEKAKDNPYKMADLEALDKKSQYEELLGHAEDITPSQRTPAWEKLVTKAAAGYMQSLTAPTSANEGVWTSTALIKRYPFLTKDADFMNKRTEAAKVASDKCLKDSYRGARCIEQMKDFLQTTGTAADVGFQFGKITRHNMNHYVAVPFFKWSFDQKKDAAWCSDEDLHLAIVAGLGLPPEEKSAADARAIASDPCFDALKADMTKALVESPTGYVRDNTCAVLKAKGAL